MGHRFDLLIIEDSEDDATILLHGLAQEGFEPAWERIDTPEGMAEALSRRGWDLVISDHRMPRFSAPAALKMLKDRGLDIPFIIVSGSIGEDVAVEAMRAGAQDFISKGRSARIAAAVGRELRELAIRRDRVRSEESLRETRARLDAATEQLLQAEKMTALGELVAGVAHEINNPLTGVLGLTQLVLRSDLDDALRRKLEMVCSETERAARIVKNLLTFARKHTPEKQHLDLNEVVEKTLELKAYHFRVNQIELVKSLAEDLPRTMIDGHQIQQVVLNLLNNAEQAISESGNGGKVTVLTKAGEDGIELHVLDTGPGIAIEIQRRIFEPFFTTKHEGKGTGLGLSLCYGIITEHQGNLDVVSQPGSGATFIVRLPISCEEVQPREEVSCTPERDSAQRSLRVLVVDDEVAVRTVLENLLSSRGHNVEKAADVPEALEMVRSRSYDLIISDLRMPCGTGQEIYEAVAAKSSELADRIIFTTGDGTRDTVFSFIQALGNEVLLKPYRLEHLESAIARVTRGYHALNTKSLSSGSSQP